MEFNHEQSSGTQFAAFGEMSLNIVKESETRDTATDGVAAYVSQPCRERYGCHAIRRLRLLIRSELQIAQTRHCLTFIRRIMYTWSMLEAGWEQMIVKLEI